MALKRGLYQPLHPFDDYPFEVFYRDSWHSVERIRISLGTLVLHIVDFGYIFEEKSFLSTLRLRPRRATLSDCTCFLRQGVDICVLSPSEETDNSWEEQQPVEARIVSVERKPHDTQCSCKFFVKMNDIQDHRAGLKGTLSKEVTEVRIDQISIFQRFDLRPANHNKPYRWASSEDCSSVIKTRVFLGKFQSDVSWMVVTSVLKNFVFDIRSMQSRLVYQVLDANYDSFGSDVHLSGLNFKLDGELSVPVVVPFVPENLLEPDFEEYEEEEDEMVKFLSYENHEVRRSKRRHVKPDRYLGEIGLEEQDITALRIGWKSLKPEVEEEETPPLLLSSEPSSDESDDDDDEEDEQSLRYEIRTRMGGEKERMKKSNKNEGSSKTGKKKMMMMKKKKIKTVNLTKLSSRDQEKNPSEDGSEQKRKKQSGKQRVHDEQHLAIVPVKHYKNPAATGEKKALQDEMNDDNVPGDNVPLKFYKRRGKKGRGPARPGSHEQEDEDGVESETRVSRENYKYWDDDKVQASYSTKQQTYGRKHHRPLYSSSHKESYNDHGSTSAPTGKKKTLDAGAYKALISAYMKNIQLTIENKLPEITDPLKQLLGEKELNDDITDSDEEEPQEEEEEDSELVMLWKEVDLTLASLYLEKEAKEAAEEQEKSNEPGIAPCQHTFEVDEEIGLLCSICGHVVTEIKDISPDFLHPSGWAPKHNRQSRQGQAEGQGKDDMEHKLIDEVGVEFICKPSSSEAPASEEDENVWALIPNMSNKLHPHQRRAYEFLWRNIAGSLIPSEMEANKDKVGGCVISHTPGAGKTFLIIAFLVSYLKLFPGKRPLVLAPKTTLYTWYKEIIKWQFPVPVYQIHGRRTYRDRIYMRKIERNNASANIVPSGDVMHVLDCLEKLQKWHAHPSVLLMGYTSFMTMMRDDSKYEYRKYMGQLLRDSPGILILDEGHNPRSTKSRLRKALMKIDTPMRILLSGTLFQNNFGEYFNTLSLSRPGFVDEVLKILDPKYKRKVNNLTKNRITIENRARKVFMDIIAKKINSGDPEERAEGLIELKNMTNSFIDVYEGGASENLPGLQAYTLMMKPTPMQNDFLVRLHGRMTESRGFPLELELMITLGSIHPWLMKTAVCANKFLTADELVGLDQYRLDPTKGSKVRFVLGLVHRSIMRKEKVLIFCHNIAPITLFLELFGRLYGWTKGEEMLVLSGELELFERGRVMDKFEEKGSRSKVMLASINACAEGISLTAASRVILLDSEWNPSKQKQAIARAFRPGQERMVYVYQLLVKGTLEEDKYGRTTWKEWVSCMIFSEESVEEPSRWQAEKIEDELLREIVVEEDHANLFHSIMKNEKASYENPLRVND